MLFVTGKGGVGKSAIATSLAARAARSGRKSLLVVQHQTGYTHPQLGVAGTYEPVRIEPNLELCSVDGRSALKEYVHRTMLLPGLYDWFLNGAALQHFIEAAPGFEELMCLGKLYDLVSASNYELVVFDGPATGHAALMLRTPRTTGTAVRTGPLHHSALKIQLMLENDVTTRIVIVSLPEEMAVREALELASYVRGDLAMHLGQMIVNRVTPQLFSAAEIDALSATDEASPSLARITRAAVAHFERASAHARHVEMLREQLPRLTHLMPHLIEVPQIVLPRHDQASLIDGIVASLGDGAQHG